RLGAIEKAPAYKGIETLFSRPIRIDVIREHWDEIIRLAASIKAGVVAPSVILKKLAAFPRQNRLDFALSELGRLERTLFMLDWLESPELRRRFHAGLNKGEHATRSPRPFSSINRAGSSIARSKTRAIEPRASISLPRRSSTGTRCISGAPFSTCDRHAHPFQTIFGDTWLRLAGIISASPAIISGPTSPPPTT